jgi:peptide/nickel transport system substrate-binding protein
MVSHPYWATEFVGAGPYRLREWQLGSGATFEAFDRYPLGRPKIDTVEVRFIPDSGTATANVLSGAVDLAVGRYVSIDQALSIGSQWSRGRPEIAPGGWVVIFPQFIDPTPGVVGDVRFRQALTHALDRNEMAATIQAGQVPVAHHFFGLQDAEYEVAQQAALRYDYNPQRAIQLIQDLGYGRDADGRFVDSARQPLTVPIWTSGGLDTQVKSMLSAADYWKLIGVDAVPTIVPTQRWNDREYVATFPAFRLNQQSIGRPFMMNLLSSAAPVRENQFVGANYSRYRSADLDALINRFVVTVRPDDRALVVQQIIRLATEQAVLIGLFGNATPMLIADRVHGAAAGRPGWDIHLWDAS